MKRTAIVTALSLGLVAVLLALIPAASQAVSSPTPTQTELIASYTVLGGGSLPPPVLNYFHNNVLNQTTLHTYQQTIFVDLGSQWSVTQPSRANSSSERWYTASALSGPIYGFTTVSIIYYHQYSVGFGYSVNGGSSGSGSPQVAFTFDGSHTSAPAGRSVWVDAGSNYSYPLLTTGSNLQQRWVLNSSGTGTVEGPQNFTATYLHQDSFELNYAIHGGNASETPTLTGIYFGSPITAQLGGAPSVTWLDAGTHFSITDPIQPSNTQLRWYAAGDTSGLVSIPENFTLVYFHQYSVPLYFSVSGGTSPGYPTVTGTAFGANETYYLLGTPRVYWFDLGASYSVSRVLPGSSQNERWVAPTTVTGGKSLNGSTGITYYHQYAVNASYSASAALPSSPDLRVYSFGEVMNYTLSENPTSYWVDNGTALFVGSSPASSPGERWGTVTPVPSSVEGPLDLTLSFMLQVPASVSISDPGLSAAPPFISTSTVGPPFRQNLTAGAQVVWLVKGAHWSIPQALTVGAGERWATNQSLSGIATAPFSVTAGYQLQYHVSVRTEPGGNSSVSSGWYQANKTLQFTAAPEAGWVFSGWLGNGTASYTGNETSIQFVVSAPLGETPMFNAVLTLRASNGGSVAYFYGSAEGKVHAGSTGTLSASPGSNVTVVASPSSFLYQFQGWTQESAPTGNRVALSLSGPAAMTAMFGFDYYALAGLGVIVALLAAGFLLYWKNRKRHSILSLFRLLLAAARKYTSF